MGKVREGGREKKESSMLRCRCTQTPCTQTLPQWVMHAAIDPKYTKRRVCCYKSKFISCRDWKEIGIPCSQHSQRIHTNAQQRGVHKHFYHRVKRKRKWQKKSITSLTRSHLLFHMERSLSLLCKRHSTCQGLLTFCHVSVCLRTNRFNPHPM